VFNWCSHCDDILPHRAAETARLLALVAMAPVGVHCGRFSAARKQQQWLRGDAAWLLHCETASVCSGRTPSDAVCFTFASAASRPA